MTEGSSKNKHQVTVQPLAALTMALHALQHKTLSVHGILVGTYDATTSKIMVQDAVPVSHGVPSKPIVEAALGLLETILSEKGNLDIVGWYTAPELLDDTRPGPVALRMAANLTSETVVEPTLIVLNNVALGELVKGDKTPSLPLVQALGKDFGQQWLQSLPVTIEKMDSVSKALQDVLSRKEVICNDFLEHLAGPATTPWYPNDDIVKHL